MSVSERLRRFAATLRARPRVAAVTGAVALAAVLTGGALAMALGGPRGVAHAPTPSQSPSPTLPAATDEPTPSTTATPAPPTPTASPTTDAPTPSETPSPTAVATATPLPTPDPTPDPTPEDRFWTALPQMPNAPDHFVRDVVVLDDGRLAVFRYERTGDQRVSLLTIEPGDERWTPIEVDEPFDDFTIWIWTQGPDGRLYSHGLVIDPSGTSWDVEPWDPGFDEEPVAPIATGPDGRLYFREAEHLPELLILDVETGEWKRSSENTIIAQVDALLVSDGLIYLAETEEVASFDPVTDRWESVTRMPYVNAARGGIGPDGRLVFLDAWESENQAILVLDPDTGEWSELPRPTSASSTWNPIFRTGPDGRLWAVDAEGVFVYLGD